MAILKLFCKTHPRVFLERGPAGPLPTPLFLEESGVGSREGWAGPAGVLATPAAPVLCSGEPGNVILFPSVFPLGRRAAWAGGPGIVLCMRLPLSSV